MKKIFAILAIGLFTLTVQAQRFGTGASSDNTGAAVSYTQHLGVVLADTDSINPDAFNSFYTFAALTHAKTVKIKNTKAKKWDKTHLEFVSDTLTAGRVITFGSTAVSPCITTTSGGTITAKTSKKVLIVFIFDGTAWVEESRSIQY